MLHGVDSATLCIGMPSLSLGSSDGILGLHPDEAPRSLRYLDFATRQIRPVFEANKHFGDGRSVSADGPWILYSQASDASSDIMLVDHFYSYWSPAPGRYRWPNKGVGISAGSGIRSYDQRAGTFGSMCTIGV